MPFAACHCCPQVVLLDPDQLSQPICARCQQPTKLMRPEDWPRIREQRRQEMAALVATSRALVEWSRELMDGRVLGRTRDASRDVKE